MVENTPYDTCLTCGCSLELMLNQIADLQSQLDAANEKGVRLKQLTIDAETKYSTERYEKKCLRNQLDSSNGERETYFRNCKDLQAQLNAAKAEIQQQYKCFREIQDQQIADLQAQLNAANAKCAELRIRLMGMRSVAGDAVAFLPVTFNPKRLTEMKDALAYEQARAENE